MKQEDLLNKVLLFVKSHQSNGKSCRLLRNPDELPEQFKIVEETALDNCVYEAIKKQGLLEGNIASNGFLNLRLTAKGESKLVGESVF